MVFIPTEGASSQAVRKNAKAIAREITKHFEEMKEKFFTNARQQLIDKNPGRLEAELKAHWDTHIDQ